MDYPKLPGLTPDGRVYWNEEMGTIEARIPNGGYRSGHGPALLELPIATVLSKYHRALKKLKAQLEVQS